LLLRNGFDGSYRGPSPFCELVGDRACLGHHRVHFFGVIGLIDSDRRSLAPAAIEKLSASGDPVCVPHLAVFRDREKDLGKLEGRTPARPPDRRCNPFGLPPGFPLCPGRKGRPITFAVSGLLSATLMA